MNNVANLITLVRIIGAGILLVVRPFSVEFFCVYGACGISDVVDGIVARKFNITSSLGQKLDSIADFLVIGVMIYIFIPLFKLELWTILWISAIAVVRLFSLIIGFIRYREVAFLHTYANKATGLALFFSVLIIPVFKLNIIVTLICFIASLSSIEELMINITSKKLFRDVRSIFIN